MSATIATTLAYTHAPSAPKNPKMVLASIHNLPKRIKSAHLREVRRTPGKENIPPGMKPIAARPSPPSFLPYVDQGTQEDPAARWLPKDGQIIIKVAVPATDDLWKLRVPEDVTLAAFVRRVEAKIGFTVALQAVGVGAARCTKITTEGAFKCWVQTRVRNGRNYPIIAHARDTL
ncbi:hypothetical protein CERSUDRAFT_67264 [Gelatoporia subvermispora B]|uniref:Uncharacterized protein n=1 Tax=Ceriporiopsis subvermispora (strain B) TaxID=914234 RepID=M2PFZ3_CERS8|nr:hypothetical protein CERSUDRAFT_67264 [Gelatoporia subvermispora B]